MRNLVSRYQLFLAWLSSLAVLSRAMGTREHCRCEADGLTFPATGMSDEEFWNKHVGNRGPRKAILCAYHKAIADVEDLADRVLPAPRPERHERHPGPFNPWGSE